MSALIIVLRLIHIIGGVFWVGTALLMTFFINPSIQATAEAGQKFLGHLITKTPLGQVHGLSAVLTVLAGASLYWIDSQGFTSDWMTSGAGLGFGIGGLFGLLGVITSIIHALNLRALATAAQVQGEPTPEQIDKIRATQKRLGVVSRVDTAVLLFALIFMATARYWRF
ncbi:MAG TPA: DUF2269 family protein [Anaerolineales bacterium]